MAEGLKREDVKMWGTAVAKDASAAEKRRIYERDGGLLVLDLVPSDMCDKLRKRAEELVDEQYDPSVLEIFTTDAKSHTRSDYFMDSARNISFFLDENVIGEDKKLKLPPKLAMNKIGHAMHELDEVFKEFSYQPVLQQLVTDLGIVDSRITQSMYIFKQAHVGGQVHTHQDATFLYSEPNTTIGLWIAIEDATLENGCLWGIPGGHKTDTQCRWVRTPRKEDASVVDMEFVGDKTTFDDGDMQAIEVKKGSVLVIHGNLPHMSLPNKSAKSRHAYTLHMYDASRSTWDPRNWLQPLPIA